MPYIDTVPDTPVALQLRAISPDFAPNETQRTTLIVCGCYIIAIAILWHVPKINRVLYPFKLLTVSLHEFSHAFAGLLTCASIDSIELDPDEGGVTRMTGGIPAITLPAGYIGSSFIGACLIACGFDTNASKVATLVLGAVFLMSLWWARRDWLSWVLVLFMSGLILAFWFISQAVALRYLACLLHTLPASIPTDTYQVLFIGVMSCMYALWDTIDDTIKRKANNSDASVFAERYGCCPSQVWGVLWLIIAFIFFAAGVLVGLAFFKQSTAQQMENSKTFIPTPSQQ